jgi:hypothetical protein
VYGTERDGLENSSGSSSKNVPYFCSILIKIKFRRHIFLKLPIINCHEIPPMGADLFHAERQTNRQYELNTYSAIFAKASKSRPTTEQQKLIERNTGNIIYNVCNIM